MIDNSIMFDVSRRLEIYEKMLIDFSLPTFELREKAFSEDGFCYWLMNNTSCSGAYVLLNFDELMQQEPVKYWAKSRGLWWSILTPTQERRVQALKDAIELCNEKIKNNE